MQILTAINDLVKPKFELCRIGSPNKDVVHNLVTPREAFDDAIRMTTPLVGGRR